MTEYMMKNDKNGKARYYKLVDGKMKNISRVEYEENTQQQTVALVPAGFWDAKPVEMPEIKPEDVALAVVKRIVSGMDGRSDEKVRLQVTKHAVLINYRNCMVCSLVFDDSHAVTAVKFMGATLESRKKATAYEVKDLNEYAGMITEQVEFIDWWWLNSSKKKAA